MERVLAARISSHRREGGGGSDVGPLCCGERMRKAQRDFPILRHTFRIPTLDPVIVRGRIDVMVRGGGSSRIGVGIPPLAPGISQCKAKGSDSTRFLIHVLQCGNECRGILQRLHENQMRLDLFELAVQETADSRQTAEGRNTGE